MKKTIYEKQHQIIGQLQDNQNVMTDILTLLQVLPQPNPIEEAASRPEIITFDVEKNFTNDDKQTIEKHKLVPLEDLLSMSVQELEGESKKLVK